MPEANREELLELLVDLKHDLGKYIRLPVAMLPRDAGADEVRAALRQALLSTRKSATGTRSARQIWEAFLAEAGDRLRESPGFTRLAGAVETALAWEGNAGSGAGVEDGAALDRRQLEQDLGGVGQAIALLMEELREQA
jgi:hypothetical protein